MLSTHQIIAISSSLCGIAPGDLFGRSRAADVVRARMLAAYLLRVFKSMSCHEIAEALHLTSHATVVHQLKRWHVTLLNAKSGDTTPKPSDRDLELLADAMVLIVAHQDFARWSP